MCSEIIESNLSRQKIRTFPALKGSIGRLASVAVSRGPIEPGQFERIEPPQSNLSRQTKSRIVSPSHRRTMASTVPGSKRLVASASSTSTRPPATDAPASSVAKVALLSLATPDKVQEKISTMNVLLQRLIRNWERSGQGDGGIDVINDGDELVDHEFGQLTNRSRGALHTRAAFLGTNQPYLLYFWEMLNKYQLLSTSFSELSSKMSSKNGGNGVPFAINGYGKDVDSDIDEIDFSDVLSSSIEASSQKSKRNDSSSATKKSKHSSRKNHTSSFDRNANFSLGLERLAQSNIISSRMDMSATLRTNILSLESELRGLDMALMDDPPPRKKAKLEEQMTAIESDLTKLKSEFNNIVATPPRRTLCSSPPH